MTTMRSRDIPKVTICDLCNQMSYVPNEVHFCSLHDAALDLLTACEEVEKLVRLSEFPSDEWIVAGRRLALLGPQVRDAIERARRQWNTKEE